MKHRIYTKILPLTVAIIAFGVTFPAHAADEVAELKAMIRNLKDRVDQFEKERANDSKKATEVPSTQKYVEVGDMPGSFKMPGTNTSIKIYGHATLHSTVDLKEKPDYATVGWGSTLIAQPLDRPGNTQYGKKGTTFMTARASRFGFLTSTPVDELGLVTSKVEADFDGSDSTIGGESQSMVRLREAYVKAGNVLVGQTFSTFADMAAAPQLVEWNGTGVSPMVRQAMVRYSIPFNKSRIDLAVENSQQRGVPSGDFDQTFDYVSRYDQTTDWGHFSVRGVALQYNNSTDRKWGSGLAASTRINLGANDSVVLLAAGGNGIGRYMFNGLIQGAAKNGNSLELWKAIGAHMGYTHKWTSAFNTTLAYAYTRFDENAVSRTPTTNDFAPNKKIKQAWVSTMYTPYKNFDLGLDYTWGKRQTFDHYEGAISRLTALARYRFE